MHFVICIKRIDTRSCVLADAIIPNKLSKNIYKILVFFLLSIIRNAQKKINLHANLRHETLLYDPILQRLFSNLPKCSNSINYSIKFFQWENCAMFI